jgi:hypothetical protein
VLAPITCRETTPHCSPFGRVTSFQASRHWAKLQPVSSVEGGLMPARSMISTLYQTASHDWRRPMAWTAPLNEPSSMLLWTKSFKSSFV